MVDNPQVRGSRIVVLGTGGTIAGKAPVADDNVGYVAGQVGVADMLHGIDAPAGIELVAEQVAQLDSKDMDVATWRSLVTRCAAWLAEADVAGIVVTHGTDTLEETAFLLHCVLAPSKPIVMVSAMRPSTALAPDGPQNLRDAIAVVATPGAHGVCAVAAGVVHGAQDVRKVHTYRLDAFDSGDAGALGYVEEGVLRRLREWPSFDPADSAKVRQRLEQVVCTPPARWPRVEIVTSHAGASGRLVDLLLRELAAETGADGADRLRGLVIASTGNGTVHRDLEAAALRAQEAGVAVMRATRCANGRIVSAPESETTSAGHVIALRSANTLTPVKARIELTLELMESMPV
ncbi:MAG TPA: asparaginase [Variovorax sp.]|nr:asparaginase [Variovorax sp.]